MLSAGMPTLAHLTHSGWRPLPSIPVSSPSRPIAVIYTPSTKWMSTRGEERFSHILCGPGPGKLSTINTVSSGGSGPCKVTVDFTGKAVFVANYDGGSAASFRVLPGGALSKAVSNSNTPGTARTRSARPRLIPIAQPYPPTIDTCWLTTWGWIASPSITWMRRDGAADRQRLLRSTRRCPAPAQEVSHFIPAESGPTPSTRSPTRSMPWHGIVSGALSPGCKTSPPCLKDLPDRIQRPRSQLIRGPVRVRLEPWRRQHRGLLHR